MSTSDADAQDSIKADFRNVIKQTELSGLLFGFVFYVVEV